MMNAENFAQNLKKYRKLKGISQSALAKELFVSPQSVSKWEKGISMPDVSNLCTLSNVLEIGCDKLFEKKDEEMSKKYFIGIDGGGTKTELILFGEDGEISSRLLLGGSNPNVVGMEVCCSILSEGIDKMLSVKSAVSGIFAGVAGSGVGDNAKTIEEYLKNKYRGISIRVCSDSVNVISSVRGCTGGVGVIWGTGFSICVINGSQSRRFAGWGYLFEDYGSGFAIGKAVLKHCLECNDSLKKPGILAKMAQKALGGEIGDRLGHIYTKGKDYVASFARIAFEAYRKNDERAKEIIDENIKWMARMIVHAAELTKCPKTIVISGGLTANADILLEFITPHLPPEAKIIIPHMPQIYGACLMCLRENAMDECINEEFEEKFKGDYFQSI